MEEDYRVCTKCGKKHFQGYFIEYTLLYEYYCSDECLHGAISKEEYNELYEKGVAFWTQWL